MKKHEKKAQFTAELISTPDGEMTRQQAAAFYGINRGTLTRRIWQGMPREKWFAKPTHHKRGGYVLKRSDKFRGDPVTLSIDENWKPNDIPPPTYPGAYITAYGAHSLNSVARVIGITRGTLSNRLHNLGWSHEDTFNTPLFGRPGVDRFIPADEYRQKRRIVHANYMNSRKNVERLRKESRRKSNKNSNIGD